VSCDCEFLDSVPNIDWLWHSKYLDGRKQMALGKLGTLGKGVFPL
jgi:hypothetical protein